MTWTQLHDFPEPPFNQRLEAAYRWANLFTEDDWIFEQFPSAERFALDSLLNLEDAHDFLSLLSACHDPLVCVNLASYLLNRGLFYEELYKMFASGFPWNGKDE